MRLRNLQRFSVAFLFGLLVLGCASNAYAVPTLSFSLNGGAAITCADQAACDLDPTIGSVLFAGSIGGFSVNITSGVTKPVFPGSHMDLLSMNVQSGAGVNDLLIMFSETGFNSLTSGFLGTFGGSMTAPTGSTIKAQGYFNTANTLGTMPPVSAGTLIGGLGPYGSGAFSGTFSAAGPGSQPYSLTQVLTLHTTGVANFSGNFELQMVPEPASVLLLGAVLFLTAKTLRRKHRQA